MVISNCHMAAFVKTKSVPAVAAAAAAAEASSMTSYVAVILDITGSMGNQIQGVKDAIRELIPLLAENPGLGIVIITFTEGGGRCVVCATCYMLHATYRQIYSQSINRVRVYELALLAQTSLYRRVMFQCSQPTSKCVSYSFPSVDLKRVRYHILRMYDTVVVCSTSGSICYCYRQELWSLIH